MYDKSSNNELFICTLLNCLNLRQYANAAAQPVISNTTLKDISYTSPSPPLAATICRPHRSHRAAEAASR